ncbi:MAG: site-specific integrase [Phototrophicaceae bacterium]
MTHEISSQNTPNNALIAFEELPLNQHPAMVYLAGLTSENSRRNMQRHLNTIALWLGAPDDVQIQATAGRPKKTDRTFLHVRWQDLRFQHTAMIKTVLIQEFSAATVNVMLSALRGVLRTAWKLGYLSAEEYQRAIDVENVRNETLPAGRDVRPLEMKSLLDTCNLNNEPTRKDIRDAALMAVLYATGIRREECAGLLMCEYEQEAGKITVTRGKGKKQRTVYIANKAKHLLDLWLNVRGEHEREIWHAIDRHGNMDISKGITSQAIYNMLRSRATQAGISDFSPHDLRRTFVGNALDAGIDTVTVSKIVGHASPATTARYDRRGERAKEKAAHKIDLPIG